MNLEPDVLSDFGQRQLEGQRVGGGRFLLKRKLGVGGMGVLWLAHDRLLREPIALKFLPPQMAFDPAALDALRRECVRSRKLSHPHIVRIHDLNDLPNEPVFISMEYVDGSDLHAVRARRAGRVLPWSWLEPLMAQLCSALDYAHHEGIIHRDLKPANLLLNSNTRLKLADFGLARVVADTLTRLSKNSDTSGTLAYMSPQQARGETPRATDDLYALGATLYELLTSTPPFHTGDLSYQLHHVDPEHPQDRLQCLGLDNDIPEAVAALILACLAKDAAKRPQRANDILNWLQTPAASPAPMSSSIPGRTLEAPVPNDPGSEFAPSPSTDCAERPWTRRMFLGGAAACAIGALGWAGWKNWLGPFIASKEEPSTPVLIKDGFQSLFNGHDLSGWDGDSNVWRVSQGAITAFASEEGVQRRHNRCLIWHEPVTDFILRLAFKLSNVITEKPANSGVLYRARLLEGREVRGYQAELHGPHTGALLLHDASRDLRTPWGHSVLLKGNAGKTVIESKGIVTQPSLFSTVIRDEDWNELEIEARGNRLVHRVNGIVTMEAVDEGSDMRAFSGCLALELKRATYLRFKNIMLKPIDPLSV